METIDTLPFKGICAGTNTRRKNCTPGVYDCTIPPYIISYGTKELSQVSCGGSAGTRC